MCGYVSGPGSAFEFLDVGHRPNWRQRDRASVFHQLERQAHRDWQRRDVVKENDAIDAQPTGCQRSSNSSIDIFRELEEG